MKDLRTYLSDLGPLLQTITEPVDPITQAGILSSEARYPILLENLKGFDGWRLADILVQTRETQAVALGTTADEVVPFLAKRMFEHGPAKGRLVETGPCKDVTYTGADVDIRHLPIPIHTVGDGGRYLGSGLTTTRDPDTGVKNVAIIRTHLRDDQPDRVGFWMAARHNWAHYMKYSERGEKMPMAYVIGMHPAYEILANFSGLHEDFDEYELAAGVIGDDLEMVRCETIDLEVPAYAEVVIEGLVPPHVREPEGPFGEFTGYQGGKTGTAPVMEVTAITHRSDPIFRHMQATIFTDHQPLVALPMEATIFNRVQAVHGHTLIHDVHVPPWASLFITVVQLTPRWDGQARDVGLASLSGPNLHPKIVILVDEDVNIYDGNDILWAISTRVDPQKDVIVIPHERIHPLDQSVEPTTEEVTMMRVGGKMVIDATKPATWRPQRRREFERVQPMGTGDASLEHILERIRAFTPARSR